MMKKKTLKQIDRQIDRFKMLFIKMMNKKT